MAYTHVIFDLDGTLIDTLADIANAVNHLRQEFGDPPLPSDVVRGYTGEGVRILVGRALGAARTDQIDAAVQRFRAFYGEHLLDHTRPYPGIIAALSALAAAGVGLSVLTNKPERFSRTLLTGLDMLRFFRAVVGGDSLPVRKPDPAGVAQLLGLTGTTAAQAILVGDSLIDLQTARAAGVAFCGVGWGFGADDLRTEGASPIAETAGEMVARILRHRS